MRTNDSKTSVDSKLEEMEEKYPVEQIAVKNEKKIVVIVPWPRWISIMRSLSCLLI